MEDFKIIIKSIELTWKNPKLWFFGLFLSSGFSFHFLYFWFWFKSKLISSVLSNLHLDFNFSIIFYLIVFIFFVVLNLLKIFFSIYTHNLLHKSLDGKIICPRCQTIIELENSKYLNLSIIPAVLLSSLLTIGINSFVIWLVTELISINETSKIISIVLLIILYSFISLTSIANMLVLLNLLWLEVTFTKALLIAVDFIIKKIKIIAEFILFLGFFYLFSLVMIGLILFILNMILPKAMLTILVLCLFAFSNCAFNISLIYFLDKYNKPWKDKPVASYKAQVQLR